MKIIDTNTEKSLLNTKIFYQDTLFGESDEQANYIRNIIDSHTIKCDKSVAIYYKSPVKSAVASILLLSYGFTVYVGSSLHPILEYIKERCDYILFDTNGYNRVDAYSPTQQAGNTDVRLMIPYLDMRGTYTTESMNCEQLSSQINSIGRWLDLKCIDNISLSSECALIDIMFWILVGMTYNKAVYIDSPVILCDCDMKRTLVICEQKKAYSIDPPKEGVIVMNSDGPSAEYSPPATRQNGKIHYMHRINAAFYLFGYIENGITEFCQEYNEHIPELFTLRNNSSYRYTNTADCIQISSNDIFKRKEDSLELISSEKNAIIYQKTVFYLHGIEQMLEKNIAVDQAAIKIVDKDQTLSCIAYYIPTGNPIDANLLKLDLSDRVPKVFIPEDFIKITELPFDSYGILMRDMLPDISEKDKQHELVNYETDPIALKIVSIIQEYYSANFTIQQIFDSFYDLGVNSLMFVDLAVNIEEEFNIEFDDELLDVELFENVAALINYIRSRII